MCEVETNRHGISLAEWDEKARELGAPEEFFLSEKREEHWRKGHSPRWALRHFINVSIVREVMKKEKDFRLGNHRIMGRKTPYRKK